VSLNGISPLPAFSDEWACDNWSDWEAVEKQLQVARTQINLLPPGSKNKLCLDDNWVCLASGIFSMDTS